MTEVAAPPIARVEAREGSGARDSVVLFVVAFVVYLLLGLYLAQRLHVVVPDAEARLLHALDVWHNDPRKLTAIGFYWPPLQTLVLLPFAVSRELSSSLVSLPLMSALFGAALLVTLERALAACDVERAARWALVAAFGLNPMIAFYGANGMAEMVYLFPLALGSALFLRWTRSPRWQYLPLSGLVFAFGVLSRYEVVFWAGIVAIGVVAVLVRARAAVSRVEASTLTFATPVLYGLLLWSFLTWEILGKPLGWLSAAAPAPPSPAAAHAHESALHLAASVLREQAGLFAATFVVAALVLLVAVRRRSVPGLVLAAALLASPLTAVVLVAASRNPGYLELRYNMRAMPLTVLAVGWLLTTVAPRRRQAASVAVVVLFVASIPLTARTMRASDLGFDRQFVRGILEGRRYAFGAALRTRACEVGRYGRERVAARNAILTDDAQTFDVMLCDGHPERYFDRVDHGDVAWTRQLDAVFAARGSVGSVRYLLVARGLRGRKDVMAQRYPALLAGPLPRFVRPVVVNPSFALYVLRSPRRRNFP